jgi:hypothetical protein
MRFLSLVFLFLGLVNATWAQVENPIRLRFRTINCLGASPVELYYKAKENQYLIVSSDSESRSPYYNLAYQTDAIVLYRKQTDPKTGKDTYNPVLSVDIKGKGHTPLLLFLPDPTSPLKFKARALADDGDSVPGGYYHYINLTPRPIRMALNKTNTTIPADSALITAPPEDGTNINVAMGVFYEGSTVLLYSNIWNKDKRVRSLVLIYLSPETDSGFCVKRIIDYPNAWKPEPTKPAATASLR